MNKQIFKKKAHACPICGETDKATFEVHRIKPGCDGGLYRESNCVTLCGNCHSKVHHGGLEIKGKFSSTKGDCLIIEENGVERICEIV